MKKCRVVNPLAREVILIHESPNRFTDPYALGSLWIRKHKISGQNEMCIEISSRGRGLG